MSQKIPIFPILIVMSFEKSLQDHQQKSLTSSTALTTTTAKSLTLSTKLTTTTTSLKYGLCQ
jgi:hypothetical protein